MVIFTSILNDYNKTSPATTNNSNDNNDKYDEKDNDNNNFNYNNDDDDDDMKYNSRQHKQPQPQGRSPFLLRSWTTATYPLESSERGEVALLCGHRHEKRGHLA
jgi:hypothetical protein